MSAYDFRSPRLYVDVPLAPAQTVALDRDQSHYLGHVLRLTDGATVLAFNGRDGEWRCDFTSGKRTASLTAQTQTRPQTMPLDIRYVFAPLKAARLDYMVQKAVEMGAAALVPVVTRHTQVARVNTERMRANVVEAAEQCGILHLATVAEPQRLDAYLDTRAEGRTLIFCDEDAERASPVAALATIRDGAAAGLDVLVGPEGGFSDDERARLATLPNTLRLSLGPRILRADTAAVAALALVQACCGDWR